MKCRIILVPLYFLLGCAQVPVPQPVPQIECRDREGQITYQGGYDEDRPGAYVRRPSPYEIIRYSKDFCKRSLEPVKEANRSPEPTPEARKSPDPVKKVNRSPQTAPAWESPDPVIEVSRSPQPVTAARKSPEPVKALSRPHGRAEALTKTFEERTTAANSLYKLAEAGNADAQNQVGLLYHEGRGVPQNFKLASHWFRKGAEQGHAGAQVNLGTLYFLGRGVSESDEEALFWFRKAAAQRDALAFAKLGRMYEQGRGVPLDFVHAHMCYNLSVAHGEKRAVENREALTRQMDPDQIAEAQRLAVEWMPEDKGAYPTTSAGSRKEGL